MDLKSLRSRKHVTQQRLASDLGISRSTVAMWENGSNEPDNAMLLNLANYFSISVDELLGRSPETSSHFEPSPSLVSQLCAAYNLNNTARAMIETIISMPPAEREVVAGLARRFSSALDRDDDEVLNRSAEQLDREKEAESKTKARA